jgi:hypothetical protein
MTVILPTVAAVPVIVALTVAAGRIVAPLAREARLITVAWLALRDTRPDQRAEIVRALSDRQDLMNGNSMHRTPTAAARQRIEVATAASGDLAGLKTWLAIAVRRRTVQGIGPES